VLAVMVYILLNTLRTGAGSVGVERGDRLLPFAVPLALGTLEGDANIATRRGQGEAGERPACEVRGREVVNVCALAERNPLVLALGTTRDRSCAGELDRIEEVRRGFPRVRFAAVVTGVDREDLRRLIRRRGWRFPIGYDRDHAVIARYGIVDCTVAFAYPGRIAMRITQRRLSRVQLAAAVRALEGASARRR
jgi:hypothetical protein